MNDDVRELAAAVGALAAVTKSLVTAQRWGGGDEVLATRTVERAERIALRVLERRHP